MIITIIGFIITLIIYFSIKDEKLDYMIIGDSFSKGTNQSSIKLYTYNDYLIEDLRINLKEVNSDYAFSNHSTRDLYNLLITNHKYEDNLSIKQIISKSEIITISIGTDELEKESNINLYLYYLDKSLEEITKITKDNIFILGLLLSSEKTADINKEIKKIANEYNINYIDLNNMVNDGYTHDKTNVINNDGQIYLKNQIKKKLTL